MSQAHAQPRIEMTLPNKLTLARILMVPVFVLLLSFPNVVTCILGYFVFLVATLTDYYDGKIARARGLVTNFGKLLDPLADKVLMAAAFVMLMNLKQLEVPGWCIVAILAREFLVTGARTLAVSEGAVIAANKWGKLKTILQMTYIFVFLFLVIVDYFVGRWLSEDIVTLYGRIVRIASLWGIVAVASYTAYSGIQFARVNWSILLAGQKT
ncbi:MAG: CDP-diacylglycerol--glycerol-3-phosphate 3-phosphatidyltransferase [bacterium]|nr:CDP-diacylglycerol--glycerol-3-phosphate 3-phosphatidyltransferase [bacterium]